MVSKLAYFSKFTTVLSMDEINNNFPAYLPKIVDVFEFEFCWKDSGWVPIVLAWLVNNRSIECRIFQITIALPIGLISWPILYACQINRIFPIFITDRMDSSGLSVTRFACSDMKKTQFIKDFIFSIQILSFLWTDYFNDDVEDHFDDVDDIEDSFSAV